MGWLWGSASETPAATDPYSKLDPTLRDFLDKESPSNGQATRPSASSPAAQPSPSTDGAPNTYRAQLGFKSPAEREEARVARLDQQQASTTAPAVPAESLYPDGRYAHLWASYRPQAEIDDTAKTDQDRLRDVIDAYQDRRAAIGTAAVENCVQEQMAERDCWENGSAWELMNMCRGKNRAFFRCYTMQSRFLKALGYLSAQRSEEEEERIQMHADKLYHEMLAREEAAEEAKKAGVEVPALPPLLSPENLTEALGPDSAWARNRQRALELGVEGVKLEDYTPETRQQLMKKLQKMTPMERELELQLMAGETRSKIEIADRLREHWAEEQKKRLARKERGRETPGDFIKRLSGWDKGAEGSLTSEKPAT
ncbi:hypothetical protein BAUCODRAFT_547292 [Baudoinia panamericana UAMH 10762]|uniref:Uncharacterized protein n=1 Tax=Baudoinia panamericana (strain UAMH 10762) TaxID=717646 RepID=M2MSB9_BAUPA|nr:uncharacterized protein BAUCODRAFT_547292 [Baudoinia panamericana UAMH 10762]EMC94398.1 hypothetical protein BAUCODRAFT_547292 [Baudoinia panamericana UAMH 10762]